MTIPYRPGDFIKDDLEVYDVKQGGMGIVYLCHRHDFPLDMAVKTIRSEYLIDQNARERILRETRIWMRLGGHPNIVRCWGAEFIRNQLFLFLELVTGVPGLGVDLRSWIRRGYLNPIQSIIIAHQICTGMQYAQERIPGLVHRDLKPENILISEDATVRVTDFGLAASLGSDKLTQNVLDVAEDHLSTERPALTRVGTILGTPPYMSPEQCRGDPVDIRSDIYAIGCILYEMLTGQWIFPTRSRRSFIHHHQYEEPRPLRAIDDRLPAELESIVSRCLQKDVEARYQDLGTLMEDLCKAFETVEGRAPRFKVLEPAPEIPETIEFLTKFDLFMKTRTFRAIGNYQEALDIAERRIASGENWWHEKAICLAQMGKHEEAEASFRRALELEPDKARLWHDISFFYIELGRFRESLSSIERALELNPKDSSFWHNKGYILNKLGRTEESLECHKQAVELDPTNELAWDSVGVHLANLGRLEEALACQERATELAPAFAKAWVNKGEAHERLGQLEEALTCLNRALALDPTLVSAAIYGNRGSVYLQLQRYDEALADFIRGIQLDPTDARLYSNRGNAYRALQR